MLPWLLLYISSKKESKAATPSGSKSDAILKQKKHVPVSIEQTNSRWATNERSSLPVGQGAEKGSEFSKLIMTYTSPDLPDIPIEEDMKIEKPNPEDHPEQVK
jgi:hypothetical protein